MLLTCYSTENLRQSHIFTFSAWLRIAVQIMKEPGDRLTALSPLALKVKNGQPMRQVARFGHYANEMVWPSELAA